MKAAKPKPADLIPDEIWKKFAVPLKLSDVARTEIAAAIETYRAFVDDSSPTGAQRRAAFKNIGKQAAALAASLAALSLSERWKLSEARGLDPFETLSPMTAGKILVRQNDKLVRYQIALRDAAAKASASISNTKSGASSRATTDFLAHVLDDILIRHAGKVLKNSNHPLAFLIRVFKIADQQRKQTSERSIKDAIAFVVKGRGPLERKLRYLYSDSSKNIIEYVE